VSLELSQSQSYLTVARDLILILILRLLFNAILCISGLPDCGSVLCKCFIIYIIASREYRVTLPTLHHLGRINTNKYHDK
jgi:hypothetical protein